jgi:hypothetical protein
MGAWVASNFSISRAWDETRELFRRDGGLFVAVALALIVLPEVVVGIVAPETGAKPTSIDQLLRMIAGLIALAGQLSLIRLALGPSTTVGDAIAHGVRRFPSAFGAVLLLVLAAVLIMVPLALILGPLMGADIARMTAQPTGHQATLVLVLVLIILALSVRFTVLSPVASAEPIGPISIIKRSWNLTRGHYWRLLGLVVLLLIAALALLITGSLIGGLLARLLSSDIARFSLGALILALVSGVAQGAFSVMASLMLARVYVQLAGREVEASVPSTGT